MKCHKEDALMLPTENWLQSQRGKETVIRTVSQLSETRTSSERKMNFWFKISFGALALVIILGSLILLNHEVKLNRWAIWIIYIAIFGGITLRNIMIFESMQTTVRNIKNTCIFGIIFSLYILLICLTENMPSIFLKH